MKILNKLCAFLLLTVLVALAGQPVSAQNKMTKIKDASVAGSSNTAALGAILELESTNKGFLTPRLTTNQRDAIEVENRHDGLMIFNTTTGCFNYWSTAQDAWLSICGTPPPAVISISEVQCGNIKINGTYKQGEFLDASHTIHIPVLITQKGTYEVSATTQNGYYFSASGTFPSVGSYVLILNGVGTPKKGYKAQEKGDELTISLNNELADCKKHIFVSQADVDFTMQCASVVVEGDYFIGMPLSDDNKLLLKVDVTNTGFWSISTNTVNGYSFSGSGEFTTTGVHTVELLGAGKPIASGNNEFRISCNSSSGGGCGNIGVVVQPVKYTLNCNDIEVKGEYTQDETLNNSHSIALKVNVVATGSTTISTSTVNGISFTSGKLVFETLGEQTVILQGSGTPKGTGDITLGITGDPGLSSTCQVKIPLVSQPVSFDMNCSSIEFKGDYAPEKAMNSDNYISLKVNVNYLGKYSLATDTQNGVSFKGEGTFTTLGENTVKLQATGTPTEGGTFNYTITSNDVKVGAKCSTKVTFIYRTMNILGIGHGVYSPGTAKADEASRAILQNKTNFGPLGTVKVQGIKIFNNDKKQGAELRNNINNNKIDIIVLSYDFRPNAESTAILVDFVKNKKGVLIHAQEKEEKSTEELINRISSGSVSVNGSKGSIINRITTIADPILQGPFMDLKGKLAGSDVNNAQYVEGYPSDLVSLIQHENQANRAWLLKHKSLGYIFIGEAGWIAGNSSNSSNTIYPAKITPTGLPQSKSYSGGTVYNSFLYGNIMAWALQYAQENTDVNYSVK